MKTKKHVRIPRVKQTLGILLSSCQKKNICCRKDFEKMSEGKKVKIRTKAMYILHISWTIPTYSFVYTYYKNLYEP